MVQQLPLDDFTGVAIRGYTESGVKHAAAAQYDTGQGPCLTAWAAAKAVLVDDIAADSRLPDSADLVAGTTGAGE